MSRPSSPLNMSLVLVMLLAISARARADEAEAESAAPQKVSFYRDIRPILQQHCHGCHQPAKQGGEYVTTDFEHLVKGGESGDRAIVPGKPEESYLVAQITPVDGEAEMPQRQKPLGESEIQLIVRWIQDGAENDTPASAKPKFDMDHPPIYNSLPVITSLAYSPDGKWLAASGYHEVVIHKSDGSGIVKRLVGMSERIESAEFSPDGTKLAVTGGSPGRMGEVQVWDVEQQQLILAKTVGYDTIYGAGWSPDSKLVSFGCPDNTVRVIDATTGEQVLFNGAHNDWVLDTIFNAKGDHVISVGRDRSAKLIELATQRFVDNITSITPGALKGGILSVARHPVRDQIVVGGADGAPKVYRMFRQAARKIGDDANLIRRLPDMPGRVFAVCYSPDGKRIAAGSSQDGQGTVNIYVADFDPEIPKRILAIIAKTVRAQNAAEKAELEKYHTAGTRILTSTSIDTGGIYAVAFHPDGSQLAAGGFDGNIRLIDTQTGDITLTFAPVPIESRPLPITQGAP